MLQRAVELNNNGMKMGNNQFPAQTSEKTIQIKGIHDGLLVTLSDNHWEKSRDLLLAKIESERAFFKGARIALDLGDIELHAADLGQLRDRLSDQDVSLWAVISNSEVTQKTALMLGIETSIQKNSRKKISAVSVEKQELEGDSAVFVQRTLRAGYRIETRNHVVILGDVNPGAEIISAGNIIVWGKCFGSVCAGVEGNRHSTVCALDLKPTQLRISELIASPIQRKGKPSPEIASINENKIVIETWNSKKR